jgi:hypothetical protein
MSAAGILHEDEHVELIGGELRVVTPQGAPHSHATAALTREPGAAYGPQPHRQGADARRGTRRQPSRAGHRRRPHPRLLGGGAAPPQCAETLLVAEVAVTSAWIDRDKAAI